MNRRELERERKNQNKKGSALILSLIFLLIISLFSSGMTQLVLGNTHSAYRTEKSIKARFIAEAGMAEAYAILKQDFNNKDDSSLFPETNLGLGTYDAQIYQSNGRVVIQSTGSSGNVKRILLVEVKNESALEAFNYGVLSNKSGELTGDIVVNGDIHSNEEWDLDGNAFVNGAANAVVDVTLSGSASATIVNDGVLDIPFPTFDFNTYYNMADPADRYTGDVNWQNVDLQPTNGVIYIDGNVRINGNSQLTGTIVATGDIVIGGTFTQIPYLDLPALMSRDGDITFRGNLAILQGMVYTATGDISILGNTTNITGNVISFNKVYGSGNLTVNAVSAIPPGYNDDEGGIGLKLVSYAE